MTTKTIRAILIVASLVTLAGYIGFNVQTDTSANTKSASDPMAVWHAGRNGGIPTAILGNPFETPNGAAQQPVLAALRLPAWHENSNRSGY